MITELNDYLTVAAPYEKRGLLLDVARVLESVVGENVYVAIDELLNAPEALDYNTTVDSIQEALLGSLETCFAKFGVYFDEDLIGQNHLHPLCNALEALCSVELNESKDYLLNLVESSSDPMEALIVVLEEISPGSAAVLEETLERVDLNLFLALKEALRENNTAPVYSNEEALEQEYIDRCQAFRKRYGRPALVGELLEHKAKLRYSPSVTVSLISDRLDTSNPKATALELYALTVYSDTPTTELLQVTTQLVGQVCNDPTQALAVSSALHELLGG